MMLSELVTAARASQDPEDDIILTVMFGETPGLPIIGHTTLAGMKSFGYHLRGHHGDPPRRASCFDLTVRLRALEHALAAPPKPEPEPPRPTGLAAKIIAAGKRRRGETR
jgi:hypothetical protein